MTVSLDSLPEPAPFVGIYHVNELENPALVGSSVWVKSWGRVGYAGVENGLLRFVVREFSPEAVIVDHVSPQALKAVGDGRLKIKQGYSFVERRIARGEDPSLYKELSAFC